MNDKTPQDTAQEAALNDTSLREKTAVNRPSPVPQDSESQDEVPPRSLHGILWIICLASIISAVFLFSLDNTIVALLQPQIIEAFGSIDKLPWVAVSFALGSVSVNLLWGKLYGKFNNKLLFIAAVVLFEVGSALCGAAPNIDAFIVGRAICGVGGGGIYIGAINLLSVTTTTRERPLYISFIGLTWGTGTVLGPIIGGAFADSSATWRWAFYINLVIGGVAAPAYIFLLTPYQPEPEKTVLERIRELDVVGAVLVVGAFVSGFIALNFGGTVYPFASGSIIGSYVTSGVLWILFIVQQAFSILTTPEHRLFPADLVRIWELDILFAQTAAAITAAFIPIYFIPLFFQFVRGDTALEAGVRLLPYIFLQVAATIATGATLSKTGIYMPWYAFGGILVIIGSALVYTIDVGTSVSRIYGYSVILGIGAGSYSQLSFSVGQVKVPPNRIPDVTAFLSFGQLTGIALSLAIASSVFLNRATSSIHRLVPDASLQEIQAAIQGASSGFFNSLSQSTRDAVLAAVVKSMNDAYVLVITAGALTVALSIFMKREKLDLSGAVAGGGA
ncbi:major facilitator superfamily-domain-containing protein [Astrocystis sublimbata]|nr:major facilitator superfamily-domain-containing protein [Astrocystis sublimbata]